jgi:DNA-directed RNA polymerase subunit alpha
MITITCVENYLDTTGNESLYYSCLLIKPFYSGQSLTIANALRRTLLSNLIGTAITGVRINNLTHEFSSIKGVREDVLEIMLNLKQIVLKSSILYTTSVSLKVKGPAIVTASHLPLPNYITLINPNQYITTVFESQIFEMEILIEQGKGYRIVDEQKRIKNSDFFLIDANFSPVKKVNYKIKVIPEERDDVKESLIFEIWTNGSILPKRAFKESIKVIIKLFYPLLQLSKEKTIEDFKKKNTNENLKKFKEIESEDFDSEEPTDSELRKIGYGDFDFEESMDEEGYFEEFTDNELKELEKVKPQEKGKGKQKRNTKKLMGNELKEIENGDQNFKKPTDNELKELEKIEPQEKGKGKQKRNTKKSLDSDELKEIKEKDLDFDLKEPTDSKLKELEKIEPQEKGKGKQKRNTKKSLDSDELKEIKEKDLDFDFQEPTDSELKDLEEKGLDFDLKEPTDSKLKELEKIEPQEKGKGKQKRNTKKSLDSDELKEIKEKDLDFDFQEPTDSELKDLEEKGLDFDLKEPTDNELKELEKVKPQEKGKGKRKKK